MSRNNSDKRSFLLFFAGIFGLAIFAYVLVSNPSITGNLLLGGISQNESFSQLYFEELGLYANESMQYNWIPSNKCNSINCSLKSLNISVLVGANSSGNVSISLVTSKGTFLFFEKKINPSDEELVPISEFEASADDLNQSIIENLNASVFSNSSNASLNISVSVESNVSGVLNSSNSSIQNDSAVNNSEVNQSIVISQVANGSVEVGSNVTILNESTAVSVISSNESVQAQIVGESNSSTVIEPSVVQDQTSPEPSNSESALEVPASESEVAPQVETNAGILTGAIVAIAGEYDDKVNNSANEPNKKSAKNKSIEAPPVFPKEFFFNSTCVETCEIPHGLNDGSYVISINLGSGISVNVTGITYEWGDSEESPVNLTRVGWNYSLSNRSGINKNRGEFDGQSDYEVIDNSEQIVFENYLQIDAAVKIEKDSVGTVISKYDYLNGQHFYLFVNPGGTISFDISTPPASFNLETSESFNDGDFHNVTVMVNRTEVGLYVDGVLAEQGWVQLNAVNATSPVSIGANVGFIPWRRQVVDFYKGAISEVKVLYG